MANEYRFSLTWTPEEYAELEVGADLWGARSVAEFVRSAALNSARILGRCAEYDRRTQKSRRRRGIVLELDDQTENE